MGFSPPTVTKQGIQAGNYKVAAEFLIDGMPYPFLKIDVDLNAYAVTGAISASIEQSVTNPNTGKTTMPDISAVAASNPLVPITVNVGYSDASTSPGPAPLFQLESGFLDQTTDSYELDMVDVVGRTSASIFQDTQITAAAQTNARGSDIAQQYFDKQAANLRSGAITPSPTDDHSAPLGKTGSTGTEFLKARRARSMWDEMQDAAIQDAYILRCHNGNFYYGPPPADNQVPVLGLSWIGTPDNPAQGDMLSCQIVHAARRTHAISVRVDGYDAKKKVHNAVTYGPSGFGGATEPSPDAIQYRFVHYPGDITSLRAKAYQIWHDIVHREYIATVEVIPDAAMMQMIANSGIDFLVQLTGVKPSHALLYQVRHASVSIEAGDSDEPSLKVKLLLCNHADEVGGGEFLA
jgi:hypothetical protein